MKSLAVLVLFVAMAKVDGLAMIWGGWKWGQSCQVATRLCVDSRRFRFRSLTSTTTTSSTSRALSTSTSNEDTNHHQLTLTAGSIHESEYEVKKSKFIGYATHVQTWDEASSFLADIKGQHPKARHWCYGFRTGSQNPQPGINMDNDENNGESGFLSERCSDDGEPTGTAGAPILGAIQGQGLTNVMCVVVRYFGGFKLGAGGLIRAYGASARQVLREAESNYQVVLPTTPRTVTVSAQQVGALYDVLQQHQQRGTIVRSGEETYGLDGSLTLSVNCVVDHVDAFERALQDATRGQAVIS